MCTVCIIQLQLILGFVKTSYHNVIGENLLALSVVLTSPNCTNIANLPKQQLNKRCILYRASSKFQSYYFYSAIALHNMWGENKVNHMCFGNIFY